MELSDELRSYLVNEFRGVAKGLRDLDLTPESLPSAIYLYSAVFGAASRVLNITYSPELVLLHLVTNATPGILNSRVNDLQTGANRAIGMPAGVFPRVAELVSELADRVERREPFDDTLAALSEAAYVTTGNGFYLFQTRGIGL